MAMTSSSRCARARRSSARPKDRFRTRSIPSPSLGAALRGRNGGVEGANCRAGEASENTRSAWALEVTSTVAPSTAGDFAGYKHRCN